MKIWTFFPILLLAYTSLMGMEEVKLAGKDKPKDPESKNYPYVNVPANQTTVSWIKSLQPTVYAEIGVATGSTAFEVAKALPEGAQIHLFDFYDKVEEVKNELINRGFKNVRGFGNSYKLRDSYNWSLMKILQDHPEPIYDYVFLDGMHTWDIDGFTFFLVDKLLKPGGVIDFDDYLWSISVSPKLNPKVFPLIKDLYTDEQIKAQGVKLVVDLLVKRNPNYIEIVENKIYQKRPLD